MAGGIYRFKASLDLSFGEEKALVNELGWSNPQNRNRLGSPFIDVKSDSCESADYLLYRGVDLSEKELEIMAKRGLVLVTS